MKLCVKDAYRDGKKLRKGPKGRVTVDVSLDDALSLESLMRQCAAALGYPECLELLSHLDPGQRPQPVTTLAEAAAVADAQAAAGGLDAAPLWVVVPRGASAGAESMTPRVGDLVQPGTSTAANGSMPGQNAFFGTASGRQRSYSVAPPVASVAVEASFRFPVASSFGNLGGDRFTPPLPTVAPLSPQAGDMSHRSHRPSGPPSPRSPAAQSPRGTPPASPLDVTPLLGAPAPFLALEPGMPGRSDPPTPRLHPPPDVSKPGLPPLTTGRRPSHAAVTGIPPAALLSPRAGAGPGHTALAGGKEHTFLAYGAGGGGDSGGVRDAATGVDALRESVTGLGRGVRFLLLLTAALGLAAVGFFAAIVYLGVTLQKATGNIAALQSGTNNVNVNVNTVGTVPPPPAAAGAGATYGAVGYGNGGSNFVSVAKTWLDGTAVQSGVTRTYYIACQEVLWNYAPGLMDTVHAGYIPDPYDPRGLQKSGWPKRRYVQYTDNSFTVTVPQPPWLGLLGPILRATVGDVLTVNFWNNCTADATIHAHGVKYNHDNSGDWTAFRGKGSDVAPGASFQYSWFADATSGPVNSGVDTSSVVWWYHSHIDEPAEVNKGLIGCLIVTGAGQANADATPIGVDKEFIIFMMVQNEYNTAQLGQMYHVNGFIFGNLPGLTMTRGDRVRWYLVGMGDDVDVHTVHWHANTVVYRGYRTDVVELFQGTMAVADMSTDNIGIWLLHCHVASHLYGGMSAFYTINPAPGDVAQPALLPASPAPNYVYPVYRPNI